MQNLETIKAKSQESMSNLIERGKQQPEEVKTWGITAAAGVAGALAVTAVAKGVLAVAATIANPPVALAVGAVGGGVLGWSFMQKQAETTDTEETSATASELAATSEPVVNVASVATTEPTDVPTSALEDPADPSPSTQVDDSQ